MRNYSHNSCQHGFYRRATDRQLMAHLLLTSETECSFISLATWQVENSDVWFNRTYIFINIMQQLLKWNCRLSKKNSTSTIFMIVKKVLCYHVGTPIVSKFFSRMNSLQIIPSFSQNNENVSWRKRCILNFIKIKYNSRLLFFFWNTKIVSSHSFISYIHFKVPWS